MCEINSITHQFFWTKVHLSPGRHCIILSPTVILCVIAVHKLLATPFIISTHDFVQSASNSFRSSNGHCQLIPGGLMVVTKNPHVPQVPTTGQVTGLSSILCGGKAFLPDLFTMPTCGRLRFFLHFLFFFEHRFPSFSMEEKTKRIIWPTKHFNVGWTIYG